MVPVGSVDARPGGLGRWLRPAKPFLKAPEARLNDNQKGKLELTWVSGIRGPACLAKLKDETETAAEAARILHQHSL